MDRTWIVYDGFDTENVRSNLHSAKTIITTKERILLLNFLVFERSQVKKHYCNVTPYITFTMCFVLYCQV